MMRQAIKQRYRQFRIAKDARPFGEAQVGGDDQVGPFVKLAEQVKQQSAAGLAERQVTQFIEDHQVDMGEPVGQAILLGIDQFDR